VSKRKEDIGETAPSPAEVARVVFGCVFGSLAITLLLSVPHQPDRARQIDARIDYPGISRCDRTWGRIEYLPKYRCSRLFFVEHSLSFCVYRNQHSRSLHIVFGK